VGFLNTQIVNLCFTTFVDLQRVECGNTLISDRKSLELLEKITRIYILPQNPFDDELNISILTLDGILSVHKLIDEKVKEIFWKKFEQFLDLNETFEKLD